MGNSSAYDFGKLAGSTGPAARIVAGVSEAPAAIRKLADRIERGDVILHDVVVVTRASTSDFAKTTLTLEFIERQDREPGSAT